LPGSPLLQRVERLADAAEHWADGVEGTAESSGGFLPVDAVEVDPAEQLAGFVGQLF
jgi:hypothetical protein